MSSSYLSSNPYKGTRDFYPRDMVFRNWYFNKIRMFLNQRGYEEYQGPILESFDIYAAKSGVELVNEQLYSFEDKSGRKLVIRPEMTPTVARLVASRYEQLSFPLKWFSIANFMRYENPQKGRLREHWQTNVDIFGVEGIQAEFEIFSLIINIMKSFNADENMFKIRISHRKLFNYLLENILGVAPDSIKLISKVIDKKSKITEDQYRKWLEEIGLNSASIEALDKMFTFNLSNLGEYIKEESECFNEIKALFALLEKTGLDRFCEFDLTIVRGFDYYTGTVFEVYDNSMENRRSLFGGGRYANLVGMFKGVNVPGIGFGMGDVTFQNFLEIHNLIPQNIWNEFKVLIVTFEEVNYHEYYLISRELTDNQIVNNIYLNTKDKIKKQFTFADRMKYDLVIIMGPDELKENTLLIKNLVNKDQTQIKNNELVSYIKNLKNIKND